MLFKSWRQPSRADTIQTIYGAIVAQARLPAFYANYGVPDTVEGRFDMIVLHLFVFLRRLGGLAGTQRQFGQAVFTQFCADLDANLREMGVGDLTVPRKMQEFAEAFYGRSAAYERALATGDRESGALAIARNIYGRDYAMGGARRLAHYMFAAAAMLENTGDDALLGGKLAFPEPADIPVAAAGT
jgi:cytochrome b pre-mRNA-processing protein 3